MKDFKTLRVWERAYELNLEVYRITANLPKEEVYGLTSQIRRASVSIPVNIAEGCGRDSEAELIRYLRIAMGSSSELECELMIAHDLGYFHDSTYQNVQDNLVVVRRMLNAFIQKLKSKS